MANRSTSQVGIRDYNPQASDRGALPALPMVDDTASGTMRAVASKLEQRFSAIADRAAQIEGARAGKVAGNDPSFRPDGATTLRGYARDQSAISVYSSNLFARLSSQMADAFDANKDDPAAFKRAADTLRQGFQNHDVFPEIAGDFNERFIQLELGYRTKVGDNALAKQNDRDKAALIDGMATSETDLQRSIAGGVDPTQIRRQALTSTADNEARIDALVTSGAITAEAGVKAKAGLRGKAASDVIIGEAGRLKTPEEIDQYREDLRQRFAANQEPGLDGDTWSKIDASLQRASQSMRVGKANDVSSLEKDFDSIIEREGAGTPAKEGEWTDLQIRASQNGDAGMRLFERARRRAGYASRLSSMTPEQAQAEIDADRRNLRAGVPAGFSAATTQEVMQFLPDGKGQEHVTNASPGLQTKFLTMMKAAPADVRQYVKIMSGYRSPQRQAEIMTDSLRERHGDAAAQRWLSLIDKHGGDVVAAGREARPWLRSIKQTQWVAPPGASGHQKGKVFDLSYDGAGTTANLSESGRRAQQWIHANAAAYGLAFPLANEPWHMEDVGGSSGRGGGTAVATYSGAAPGASGYGLTDASYKRGLDLPGEGGHVAPRQFYQYLKSIGASDNEAVMLTGAAANESSFNPNATHDGGTGSGLFGHNHGRIDMRGKTWQQQASLALQEVRSRPEGKAIANASTPEELADAQMHFERPRGYKPKNPRGGDNYSGRLNTIRRFREQLGEEPDNDDTGDQPGFTRDQAEEIQYRQKLVDGKSERLKNDQLGAVAQDLGFTIPPYDPTAADAPAQIAQRVGVAGNIAKAVGKPVRYFRPDEKIRLQAALAEGGDNALGIMTGIVQGARDHAPAVLAEIGEDSPVMAQIGAIIAQGGSLPAARDAMMAVELRKQNASGVPMPPKSMMEIANEVIGRSLESNLEERSRITQLAGLIFSTRVSRLAVDPDSPEGAAIYRRALVEASGGMVRGKDTVGGFVEMGGGWFGARPRGKVAVPPGMSPALFTATLDAIRDDDLRTLKVPPVGANGQAYSAADLGAMLPVLVDGGYAFRTLDPQTGQPVYARGADGRRFVLAVEDLRLIGRVRRLTGEVQ